MDSQERHEMKQNDLQEFLMNFREWWARYGTMLMLVILVALAAFVFTRWYAGRETRALEAAYSQLDDARASGNPFALQEVAVRHDHVPGIAGMARLEAADMILQDVLGLMPQQQTDQTLTEEDRAGQLQQAAQLYQRVIELDQSPLQSLNARFGLAAVRESQGDFDAARQQYEQIRRQAGDAWPTLARQAEQRMSDLNRIATPISFPEAAAPPEIPGMEGDAGTPLELPPGLIPEDGGGGAPPAQPEQPTPPSPAAPDSSDPGQQPAPSAEPEAGTESEPQPQPEPESNGG